MATIRVRSSHISGGGPPILGSGLGPLGSDQGMRKTASNLAAAGWGAARGLGGKKTRSGIHRAGAPWPASFLMQRCVRIWPGSSPWSGSGRARPFHPPCGHACGGAERRQQRDRGGHSGAVNWAGAIVKEAHQRARRAACE